MEKPIFIFSLPRSGSTLLQRILSNHSEVCTVSEPWILLPFIYALKRKGVYAEYNHNLLVTGMENLYNTFPNGVEDYQKELREFISRLYKKAYQKDAKYFLDKTPRYHLIVEDIINLFPEGKFIFLWRNPLSIISSMIETWASGRWQIYKWKIDLYNGLINLLAAKRKYSDRILSINYEKLINDTSISFDEIFQYLSLSYDEEIIKNLSQDGLQGGLGDKIGTRRYDSISDNPLYKWKHIINTPIRKTWCRRYLNWIGNDRLYDIGYDLKELRNEIDRVPMQYRYFISDIHMNIYGFLNCLLEFKILKKKLKLIPNWNQMHIHK